MPVREALLQLENLGLVRRVPDTGTTVTKLTRAEMVELVEVRAHLEDLAFRLAAKRTTPELVQLLRKAAKEISRRASTDDYYAAARADLEFHRIVWQASGNSTLERTLEKLCTAFYAFVSQQRRYAGEHLKDTLRQHEVLIDALLSKKASAISRGGQWAHQRGRAAFEARFPTQSRDPRIYASRRGREHHHLSRRRAPKFIADELEETRLVINNILTPAWKSA